MHLVDGVHTSFSVLLRWAIWRASCTAMNESHGRKLGVLSGVRSFSGMN